MPLGNHRLPAHTLLGPHPGRHTWTGERSEESSRKTSFTWK